jgi:hypothetical protein
MVEVPLSHPHRGTAGQAEVKKNGKRKVALAIRFF